MSVDIRLRTVFNLLRFLFVFFADIDDLMNVLIGIQRGTAQSDV